MSHFAHINKDGIVDSVIVIEQDVLHNNGGWYVGEELKPESEWVQTSYNAKKGEYVGETTVKQAIIEAKNAGVLLVQKVRPTEDAKKIGTEDDMKARNRRNYAGIGYSYDTTRDAFIPPQPFNSWTLDEETCTWVPPKPFPNDGNAYRWDEELLDWVIRK